MRSIMPKKKTKKMVSKRVKKTATGKLMFRRPGSGHLLSSKTRKQKRNMRGGKIIHASDHKRIAEML
jgi:large subunit ribosomal protein L35